MPAHPESPRNSQRKSPLCSVSVGPAPPPGSPRNCPLCGSPERAPLLQKQTLTLVRCAVCAMVYSEQTDPSFSDGSYYQTAASDYYASAEKLAGDYSPVRYRREIRLVRRFCPGGRVLDVGCSTGGFLYYLRETFPNAYTVTGLDVASGALETAASKGIPVLREDFFALEPADWDAITFWAVLEHTGDSGAFLRQAARLARPGGRCFVLVPNFESLAVKILGAKYRYILPQHLNYFTAGTLRALAERAGWKVRHTQTMHFNPLVILQDLRSRGGWVADRDRARLLVLTNRLKAHPALGPLRWAYGAGEAALRMFGWADNLVIVAEKPGAV